MCWQSGIQPLVPLVSGRIGAGAAGGRCRRARAFSTATAASLAGGRLHELHYLVYEVINSEQYGMAEESTEACRHG